MNSLQWKKSLRWKVCNETNEIFSITIQNFGFFQIFQLEIGFLFEKIALKKCNKMLWGCHFSNFKPILGQIPEFELFGSFFSLKLDNFKKLCIKNCNRNPRDGSFFEIFYEIWPIIINFFFFCNFIAFIVFIAMILKFSLLHCNEWKVQWFDKYSL